MTTTIQPVNATAIAIRKSLEQIDGALAEFEKIEAGFAELEAAHPSNLACVVTTAKGMKEAIAGRAAWRDPRIATEKARKAGKAPVLALGKDLDARAAAITTRLEAGEANYDDQIKAEEARKEEERQAKVQQEMQRVSDLQVRVGELRGAITVCNNYGATAAQIQEHIVDLVAVPVDATFQEFQQQAEDAKAATLTTLRDMHAAAVAREAEVARVAAEREELDRLRAEQEARNKAERERIAAEQRAEADRLAADRAALEQQQVAARAEQTRLDAEAAAQRRAADEESARVRAEADRQAREQRDAEDRRIATERAELQRQQDEQRQREAAAARERMNAEAARLAAEHAAQERITGAAPLMFDALKQWLRAEEADDSEELANARLARDAALEAAGELLDVPY